MQTKMKASSTSGWVKGGGSLETIGGGVAHRGRARLFTHSVTLLWSEVLYTFLYRWHPQKLKVTGVLLRIGAQAPLGFLSNGFNLATVALFRPPG